jgi:urease accessory protein
MLKAEHIIATAPIVDATLTLPFELRQKSRLKAALDSGREILLQLPRGHVLRHGTLLGTNEGSVVQICSADESLSVVSSEDPAQLLRAAYHLGNRHVAVQIGQSSLAYLHDHVLDDMLRGLGLSPRENVGPFEPEPGAYGHGAVHQHSHEH